MREGLIGQVSLGEELLHCEPRSRAELSAMSVEELDALVERLRAELARQSLGRREV